MALRFTHWPITFLVFFASHFALLSWGEEKPNSPVRVLLKENRLEEAHAICKQYEVLSTHDTEDRLACAWVYLRSGHTDLGEKILEEQKKHFRSWEYQLLRGYALSLNKKVGEAKKIYDTIALSEKGKPAGLTAQELTAELYDAQDKLSTAGFIYNFVMKADPHRGQSAWGLARFYHHQKDIRHATQYLEVTTKLWPKHLPSRLLLGKLYLSLGPEYNSTGFNWLKEAYQLNPSHPEVLEQLGLFFEQKKNMVAAMKYWQKAVEIKPELTVSAEKLKEYDTQTVQSLFDKKRYAQVVAKLESNKKLAELPEMLLIQGQSYRNLDQYAQAITALKAYLQIFPKNPLAHRELGIAYLNQKSSDLAAEAFAKAVLNDPSNGINCAWLARTLEERGDLSQAKEYWEKALVLLQEPEAREKATRKISSLAKRIKKRKPSENDEDE